MPLLTDQHLRGLLVACRYTRETEIDCEELLRRLPAFVEAGATGTGFTKVEEHLRLCADCYEEAQALSEALSAPEA